MEYAFLIQLPLLFFSIIIHEFSHGLVAHYFGDDTARLSGRLTLNPVPHIDPMGSILLPLFCYFTGAPMFGWAKPVPVNEMMLERRPLSSILVAAIGPLSNFILASLAALIVWILGFFLSASYYGLFSQIMRYMILVNLYLGVFNLLPIFPLDGSRVLVHILPWRWADLLSQMERHSFLIIMILMFTGVLSRIITPVVFWMYHLLTAGLV